MAREFDGTNDSVDFGDIPAISDATVLTGMAWVWNDNTTQDHCIASNSPASGGRFTFVEDDVGSVTGRTNMYKVFIVDSGLTTLECEGASNSAVANAWQHVLFTFEATNEVQLWVDGSEDANSPFSAASMSDMGNSNTGLRLGENPSGSQDRDGRLAWVTFWDVLLSDNEKISLAKGTNPLKVRPANRIFCAPLRGDHSPEIDLSGGGYTGTVTGATKANGPPVEPYLPWIATMPLLELGKSHPILRPITGHVPVHQLQL